MAAGTALIQIVAQVHEHCLLQRQECDGEQRHLQLWQGFLGLGCNRVLHALWIVVGQHLIHLFSTPIQKYGLVKPSLTCMWLGGENALCLSRSHVLDVFSSCASAQLLQRRSFIQKLV